MAKLNQSIKEIVIGRKKLLMKEREYQSLLGRERYEEISKRCPLYKIEPLHNTDSAIVNLREEIIENIPRLIELELESNSMEMANLLYKYPFRGTLIYWYYSIVK